MKKIMLFLIVVGLFCSCKKTTAYGELIKKDTTILEIKIDEVFKTFITIKAETSNIAIGIFKFRASGENIKVSAITFTPRIIGTTGGLKNLMLYFNGAQVGTIQDWSSGSLIFHVGAQCKLIAGVENTFEIRADMYKVNGYPHTFGNVAVDIPAEGVAAQGLSTMLFIKNKEVKGSVLTIIK